MPISRIETASLDSALVAPTATALTTASGSAPSYSARAWVNFNGTGTVAIRASGNVSSITDNNVGLYTANFTTAMPDANYAFSGGVGDNSNTFLGQNGTLTSSAIQFYVRNTSNTPTDEETVTLAIFR
jgi:hypothetical protein